MTEFVMALLVVQVLCGLYQFSFVMAAGRRDNNAHATRLPDPLVFGHALLGFLAPTLWLIWMSSRQEAFIWATLASLLLSVGGGLVMFAKTVRGKPFLDRASADPADSRVVEKQIPGLALAGHGVIAAVLVASVTLVGVTA